MLFKRWAFCFDEAANTSGSLKENSIVKSLAREVDEAEVLGLRNMAWKPASDSAFAPPVVDFQWLMQQPELPFLVPLIPAATLHRSLMAHGFDDSLEVIEWIRGRQLVRVFDHDIWAHDTVKDADDISLPRVIEWFRCWLEIGRSFLAERISELEEETIVLLLSQILEIQPEGLGRPDPDHVDDYWPSPDGRFHLRVKDTDPEVFEIIKQAVDCLFDADMKYAGSMFSYASLLVREEALDGAERWRKGRLADEGFVDRTEAIGILRPRKISTLKKDIAEASACEQARRDFRAAAKGKALNEATSLRLGGQWEEEIGDIVQEVRTHLLSLDTVPALNALQRALGDAEVKLLLGPNVRNPEVLLDDAELVDEAVEALVARSARLLWQGETAAARPFGQHRLLAERVFSHISEVNPAEASDLKARLSRVSNTFLAGTSSHTDADALGRSLAVVRGAVNIGLEIVAATPQEFGLRTSEGASLLETGVEALGLVGPEFLFHLGWNTLCDLALRTARVLDSALALRKPALPLEHLLGGLRYVEIRRWLGSVEAEIPQEVHHVVASLLNHVPLFPEVLALREPATRATRDRRAFETMNDVSLAREFLENFPRLDLE